MANTEDGGFPEGVEFIGKKESPNEFYKEFKSLTGTLGNLVKSLNKLTNADGFIPKTEKQLSHIISLLESTKREANSSDPKIETLINATRKNESVLTELKKLSEIQNNLLKDILAKDRQKDAEDVVRKQSLVTPENTDKNKDSKKVLDSFDKYMKSNEQFKNASKEQQDTYLKGFKDFFEEEKKKSDLYNSTFAELKEWSRHPARGTESGRETSKRMATASDNVFGGAVLQNLLDINPIFRAISDRTGFAESKPIWKAKRDSYFNEVQGGAPINRRGHLLDGDEQGVVKPAEENKIVETEVETSQDAGRRRRSRAHNTDTAGRQGYDSPKAKRRNRTLQLSKTQPKENRVAKVSLARQKARQEIKPDIQKESSQSKIGTKSQRLASASDRMLGPAIIQNALDLNPIVRGLSDRTGAFESKKIFEDKKEAFFKKEEQPRDEKGRFTSKKQMETDSLSKNKGYSIIEKDKEGSGGFLSSIMDALTGEKKAPDVPMEPNKEDVRKLMGKDAVGPLYLGKLLRDLLGGPKTKEEERQQVSGGGVAGAILGILTPGFLTTLMGTLAPFILPALGAALGIGALALLITAMVKDTEKRNEEKAKIEEDIRNDPAKMEEAKKRGLSVPKKDEGGMVETTKTLDAVLSGKGYTADLSGSNLTSSYGNMGDNEIAITNAALEDKEKHRDNVASKVGGDPLKTRGLYWNKINGQYFVSKNSDMKDKEEWVFDDGAHKGMVWGLGEREKGFLGKVDEKKLNFRMNLNGDGSMAFDNFLDSQKGAPVKFHQGGIVGNQQIMAQNGEAVLPVQETQKAMNAGMLTQSSTGAMTVNTTAKSDIILQQIYELLSGTFLTTIQSKKSESETEKKTANFASLPVFVPSYGGA